jgi:hypothetical protein
MNNKKYEIYNEVEMPYNDITFSLASYSGDNFSIRLTDNEDYDLSIELPKA